MSPYRADIDGLRAVAILAVVLFHYFPSILPSGFIGVDIFFVISGFLITGIIEADPKFSYSAFYAHRIRRLMPALLTVLLAAVLFGTLLIEREDLRHFGDHIIAGTTFTSNILLLREMGYFDVSAIHKPLMHLWSLGVEEQFYLLWPALLLWTMRSKKVFKWSLPCLFLISLLFNLIQSFSSSSLQNHMAFYLLPARFWELLIGCALSHASRHSLLFSELKKKYSNAFSIVGLCFLVFGLAFITDRVAYPGYWALLPTLSALFFLMSGPSSWISRKILSLRPMVFLGKISYPLYLWHWLLLSFSVLLAERGIFELPKIFVLLISSYLAFLTWKWIEMPIRHLFSSQASRSLINRGLFGCAFLCLVLLSCGLAIHNGELQLGGPVQAFLNIKGIDHPIENDARLEGKCFLLNYEHGFHFDENCYPISGRKYSKTLLVVGDSQGAFVYPGLKDLSAELKMNVFELTATSCLPLQVSPTELRLQHGCDEINGYVRDAVTKAHPDVIVLFGMWDKHKDLVNIRKFLAETIDTYHQIGVPHVILMGSPPIYLPTLPLLLEANYLQKGLPVPTRIQEGVIPPERDTSEALRNLCRIHDCNYIDLGSPPLCNQEGCLSRVGDSLVRDLVSYDSSHLSRSSSRYLMKEWLVPILKSYGY